MKLTLGAKVVIVLDHQDGDKNASVEEAQVNLTIGDNLDSSKYLDNSGLPTAAGSQALMEVLTLGLINNIKNAHERGFKNDAQHLREIVKILEDGFIAHAETGDGTFSE